MLIRKTYNAVSFHVKAYTSFGTEYLKFSRRLFHKIKEIARTDVWFIRDNLCTVLQRVDINHNLFVIDINRNYVHKR